MNDCAAHKAFTLVWSVTDKIFDHVADIENLLNTTCVPIASNSPDDPPSYESSTLKQLIDQLKERVNCLEDLNKQRKLLYDQYADEENQCDQAENVHSEEKQQVLDKEVGSTHPDTATPRDVAIKALRSFLRARQAALIANHNLLAQIRQGISALSGRRSLISDPKGKLIWVPEEESKFYAELKLLESFCSRTIRDRSSLLKNGKGLKEKILSVPHDAAEEKNKVMERVENSYKQAEEIAVPTFVDILRPIFSNLPDCVIENKLKTVLYSVIGYIDGFNDRYLKTVAANQEALQDLADLLVP